MLKFCRLMRGRTYAAGYRVATALNAALRLALLTLIYPFRRIAAERQLVNSRPEKWIGVLKWALGFHQPISEIHNGL